MWTFFLLLFVLLSPILGYILAVLLFPTASTCSLGTTRTPAGSSRLGRCSL